MNYKIVESGKNWWHLRSDPKSMLESFTVTIVHDGTIVLTGDYGTLCLKRECFPKNMNSLIGWPNEETFIGYFSEKVCNFGVKQEISEWNESDARKEIVDYFKDLHEDIPNSPTITEIENDVKDMCFETEREMYDALNLYDNGTDWYECTFGVDYTKHFRFQFEILKCWTKEMRRKDEEEKEK